MGPQRPQHDQASKKYIAKQRGINKPLCDTTKANDKGETTERQREDKATTKARHKKGKDTEKRSQRKDRRKTAPSTDCTASVTTTVPTTSTTTTTTPATTHEDEVFCWHSKWPNRKAGASDRINFQPWPLSREINNFPFQDAQAQATLASTIGRTASLTRQWSHPSTQCIATRARP